MNTQNYNGPLRFATLNDMLDYLRAAALIEATR